MEIYIQPKFIRMNLPTQNIWGDVTSLSNDKKLTKAMIPTCNTVDYKFNVVNDIHVH